MSEPQLDLLLIRHGETEWNRARRIQGHTDAPLTPLGEAQARRLGERLRNESFDEIHASDSGRAQRTAALAFPGLPVRTDERLREMHYGVLEGKTRAEFSEDDHRAYNAYRADPYGVAVAEGESWGDLKARVSGWLATLPPTGRVAAVSHGGTIRAVLLWAIDAPSTHDMDRWNFVFGNTGITRIGLGGGRRLIKSVNDTAHLEGLEDDRPAF